MGQVAPAADTARIEDRIDKTVAANQEIDMSLGGVRFQTMLEIMEFAKLMSVSGLAVPQHLRNNPGACLAICTRALRFGFDPFALAEHSYSMKKSQKVGNAWVDVETIAFDSFVISAIINAHANLTGRIDFSYSGEGTDRKCKAFATPRAADKPLEHESPTIGAIKNNIGRNDGGKIKGSPLWDSPKADQQLAYDTRRDFCRKFFPEVLLGWYDKEELEEWGGKNTATDQARPEIARRLARRPGSRGFHPENVGGIEHKPGAVLDTTPRKGEADPVPVSAAQPAAEAPAQQLALAGDVETELKGKIDALANIETKADLTAVVAATTDYLKGAKRTDLLNSFLSAASAREKKLRD